MVKLTKIMKVAKGASNVRSRLDSSCGNVYIDIYYNDVRFITHYWIGVVARYWLEEGRQVHSLVG
jgi:hypothetical protein